MERILHPKFHQRIPLLVNYPKPSTNITRFKQTTVIPLHVINELKRHSRGREGILLIRVKYLEQNKKGYQYIKSDFVKLF